MAAAAKRSGQLLGRRPAVAPAEGRGGRSEEVRRAAARLFAERGYHGTNMADIARELGLGAPGLYNHIQSKHALLEAICLGVVRRAIDLQREAVGAGDAPLRLRRAAEAHVRLVLGNRAEALVADREFIHLDRAPRKEALRLRHEYELGFRSVIEAGRRTGDFQVREPKLASFAIIEMGTSAAAWFRERGPWSVETVAEEFGRYALRLAGHSA